MQRRHISVESYEYFCKVLMTDFILIFEVGFFGVGLLFNWSFDILKLFVSASFKLSFHLAEFCRVVTLCYANTL